LHPSTSPSIQCETGANLAINFKLQKY